MTRGKGKGDGKPNQRKALSVIEKYWTHLHGGAKDNRIMAPTSRWQHSPPMSADVPRHATWHEASEAGSEK